MKNQIGKTSSSQRQLEKWVFGGHLSEEKEKNRFKVTTDKYTGVDLIVSDIKTNVLIKRI